MGARCRRFESCLPDADSYNGKTYVVFGQKESNNPVELSDIAVGIGGFVIHGESPADYSGYSVSSAGDVNSDDCSDLIIGAIGADTIGADLVGTTIGVGTLIGAIAIAAGSSCRIRSHGIGISTFGTRWRVTGHKRARITHIYTGCVVAEPGVGAGVGNF